MLETYRKTGLGGVEVTCLYGIQGCDEQEVDYLSSRWIRLVKQAAAETKRLGMLLDLPPGSGWRIGGPYIDKSCAAARLCIRTGEGTEPGTVTCVPSGEPVKRPGRGGEGLAFNPFSAASFERVKEHLSPALHQLAIRAQFHDSWEYESNCAPELFERFKAVHGYDFRELLSDPRIEEDHDRFSRTNYDLQVVLDELALHDFILPWVQWCHKMGQQSRNQAHGTPGNWLDFYAAADIPETEVFKEITPDTPLLSKFASSAAHVTGKKLISSETGTWLKEHFHTSLGDLKLLTDLLFISGINHHVYHGTAYSPSGISWPGWLFYASAQINPQNSLWHDFPKLNEYVTRCQSLLQEGTPDNDLLVYFPVHDVFHNARRKPGDILSIEGDWFRGMPACDAIRSLWTKGYAFDFISDRQLDELKVHDGKIISSGGAPYRALTVPPCRYMPESTLHRLLEIRDAGGQVLFDSSLPEDVPGLSRITERRSRFKALLSRIQPDENLESALADRGIFRETLMDLPGLFYIRRKYKGRTLYFIANQGKNFVDEWISLSVDFDALRIMDPMSGATGLAQIRNDNGRKEIRIQMDPGESWFLCAADPLSESETDWIYRSSTPFLPLAGRWTVEFTEGGPELPPSAETDTLHSWTDFNDAAAKFAGTAVYRMKFDAPAPGSDWLLDLGTVYSSAGVRLNGTDVSTLIGPSFKTVLCGVQETGNLLEIEVTNLAANRIRDLDRRGIHWKKFKDINFVNREYEPFDASGWPLMPSGLIGPVRIQKL